MEPDDVLNAYKKVGKMLGTNDTSHPDFMKLVICRILVGKIAGKYNIRNYDVARLMNMSKDTLSRILTNRSPLPNYFIPTLCFYLGYTLDDFLQELNKRDIDGYIDGSHNLIINGLKIDKIDPNLFTF